MARPSPAPSATRDATRTRTLTPPGPGPAAPGGGLGVASLAVVALATLALAWIAFARHPVGDYFTESDFYGYAEGARAFRHGALDFARYSVVGPVYELLLAALTTIVPDAFRAGELISLAAAAAVMLLWLAIVRRRAGEAAALWTVMFIAANPGFARYGYSTTTDMLALGTQSAAAWALLAARGRRAPLAAGALVALAALTRYSALALLPAGAVILAVWPPRDDHGRPARRRALLLFAAGFAALALPWLALSLRAGHWPGSNLVESFSFYTDPSAQRNVQDVAGGGGYRSLAALLREQPGALAGRLLGNVPDHLMRNLRSLIGEPVAWACGAGLVVTILDGGWRAMAPVGVAGAFVFAALVPVFYSDRYALPLVPYDLALAGLAAGSRRLRALPLRAIVWAALMVPLALSLHSSVTLQRWVESQLPVETLAAGRALRAVAPPGARVLSRKMHVAYYSGTGAVAFPRVKRLAELADAARVNGAGFLYFSWYEAELRPEFWYLLDSTATVPGLERIPFPARNPALLFRIGPEFGRDPAWLSNDSLRSLHIARAQVQALEDREAWSAHFVLGEEARGRGDLSGALDHYLAATRGNPGLALAWQRAGGALLELGRIEEARGAYERARALVPDDAVTLIGIGWTQMRSGRADLATQTWRPLVSSTRDPATLRAMAEAFDRAGDAAARDQARRALAALPGGGR